MPRARGWVFTPDRGGTPIPEPVRRRTEERIRRYAEQHFAGCYTRLGIRFHGQFCYIDAYTEPAPRHVVTARARYTPQVPTACVPTVYRWLPSCPVVESPTVGSPSASGLVEEVLIHLFEDERLLRL